MLHNLVRGLTRHIKYIRSIVDYLKLIQNNVKSFQKV